MRVTANQITLLRIADRIQDIAAEREERLIRKEHDKLRSQERRLQQLRGLHFQA
jgi:hypothetical protein